LGNTLLGGQLILNYSLEGHSYPLSSYEANSELFVTIVLKLVREMQCYGLLHIDQFVFRQSIQQVQTIRGQLGWWVENEGS